MCTRVCPDRSKTAIYLYYIFIYNDHRSINPAVVLCYIDNAVGLGICPPKDPLYKIHVKCVYITPNMIIIYYNAIGTSPIKTV